MMRFLPLFLLAALSFAEASPQLFPIRIIYFRIYSPPPLIFQARLGGGFRAYLPDDCGVESFEFKCRKNREDEWKGGNVTMKMGEHWIYEDPKLRLNPGERLYYTGTVMNRGKPFPLHQDAEWIVPEKLPSAFTPPVVKEKPKCPKEGEPEDRLGQPEENTKKPTTTEESTPKSSSQNPTSSPETNSSTTPKEVTTTSEATTMESETPKTDSTTPESDMTTTSGTTTEMTTPKSDTTTPKSDATTPKMTTPKSDTKTPKSDTTTEPSISDRAQTEPPEKSGCPWVDITPADTKEKALQNSLGRIQCDLATFAYRTALLNQQLTQELIDLKKLNYATVARLQRLESLTRSLPRNLPYPF